MNFLAPHQGQALHLARRPLNSCRLWAFAVLACALLSGCEDNPWNSPYPPDSQSSILYASFSERPKYLDPVRAYSSNEYGFLGQIYEPVLQYHYLKRPYTLTPLTASSMPRIDYWDEQQNPTTPEKASYVRYTIDIRQDIRYQPHPAFAKHAGQYTYYPLSEAAAQQFSSISDFPEQATRPLRSSDYVYQIKRLANPELHSPIASIVAKYVVGFSELRKELAQHQADHKDPWMDLRKFPLTGVQVIDDHRYQITVRSGYPQFIYWLAMPFFSPMPWEADRFYSQPGFEERNISLNWYPLGTGAYMLSENNPNMRMVLDRNPNFREDYYPQQGAQGDAQKGLLDDAGVRIPQIEKAVFNLEKESIPYWNKFIQGYYDRSGIGSDSFDQAIQFSAGGEFKLTKFMQDRGIKLSATPQPTTIYIGFNMLDPIVGGYEEHSVKLRQAISIAINMEEFISIFQNGRGIPAQSPLPPGIFGYRGRAEGINPTVYRWVNGKPQRRSLAEAKRLLAEAGYANGVDQRTGKPLVLYFDAVGAGPDAKSWLNWMTKQFAKLDIQLVTRNTDYNRFQEKIIEGTGQIFRWGWNADYPDPENFLFLLYGPNSKAKKQGENAVNYNNPEFNQLFRQMSGMKNSPERQQVINRMLQILQQESPWIWGFHPNSFVVHHDWLENVKPNLMAHNTLKYLRINPQQRAAQRKQWNQPVTLPLFISLIGVLLLVALGIRMHRKRQQHKIL